MFKAIINNSNVLKTSFNAISSIIDEVQIQTDNEGIRLNAIDRSHITFVHLELKNSLFDEYICDEPEKINLDTDELMKVLKRSKSDDIVTMSLDEGNLVLTFDGEAKRTFKIRLIDLDYNSAMPPELNYPVNIELPFTNLKEAVQDINILSEKIKLTVDSDKFIASAQGKFGDANVEYLHGENVNTTVSSIFSLEKISEMLRADKFAEFASLSLGDEMPLKLTLRMVSDDGELSFLLAPRIEEDM